MAFFKTMWKNNSKHRKLPEERYLQNNEVDVEQIDTFDSENDVATFKLKYLGSTVVEKVSPSENISTEAVKNILKTAKAAKGRKKLQRVNVNVSLKGIAVTDLQGNDILKISIYRISNCATDAGHRQIFSFISTDSTETMECHAFLCSKRKTAETVTLAVARAFGTAYDAWRGLPPGRLDNVSKEQVSPATQETLNGGEPKRQIEQTIIDEKLIDFDDEGREADIEAFIFEPEVLQGRSNFNGEWVCFDDDLPNENPPKHFNNMNKFDLILA